MRLARIRMDGRTRPVVLVTDDEYVDVSGLVDDFGEEFWDGGGLVQVQVAVGALPRHPIAGVTWLAPVPRPHQILCIGLNYVDHALESGMDIPTEPVVFSKSPNTLVGPYDDVLIPRGSQKTDWEVELGIVIGRRARYLQSDDEAMACVAGYCLVNDVSERAFQLERGGQWLKGKSCETFNPCGPWLLTADEVPDPQNLSLWLDVNGIRMQSGTTSTMIFPVATIVRYLSQFLVLEPGDLINTGTPPGVGMGQKPPRFLAPGDVVELGIDGLGFQRQRLRPAS